MTYIVNEKCVNCRFTDCVEVCPVDCFYIGENIYCYTPSIECIDYEFESNKNVQCHCS